MAKSKERPSVIGRQKKGPRRRADGTVRHRKYDKALLSPSKAKHGVKKAAKSEQVTNRPLLGECVARNTCAVSSLTSLRVIHDSRQHAITAQPFHWVSIHPLLLCSTLRARPTAGTDNDFGDAPWSPFLKGVTRMPGVPHTWHRQP